MKKNILLITFILLLFNLNIFAQKCKNFTKTAGIEQLGDFMLSGRTRSIELHQGEEIVIYKTVSRNLLYKFIIVAEQNLPKPHFIIADWNDNIIYDNQKDNFASSFIYPSYKSQRLKIWIKIPGEQTDKKGCVSLVIGIKTQR